MPGGPMAPRGKIRAEWRFTNTALDENGRPLPIVGDAPVEAMGYPVRCACRTVYDLEAVTVTGRYGACSMWTTPCCGLAADDRDGHAGWTRARTYPTLRGRR